jgi:hypothetical protein
MPTRNVYVYSKHPSLCGFSARLVIALTLVLAERCVTAADAQPEPDGIRTAISKARDYLLTQQRDDGSWEAMRSADKRSGATALVMLALADAGVPAEHPAMRRALAWLRQQMPDETYSVALQTMILAMLAPEADRAILKRNVEWLERAQVKQGPGSGSWTYGQSNGVGMGDNSNSQFAVLGLHEASRAGVPVRDDTWVRAQQYWVACHNVDGSWGYTLGNAGGSGSMTCAGIASVCITVEHIGTPDARAVRDSVACCGGGSTPRVLEQGLAWLGKRFTVSQNPGTNGQEWLYYYLFGLEHVGRFTARRFVGGHDWYTEGANTLIASQNRNSGSFVANQKEDSIVASSFALLFLARRPVIVAKSSHGPAADWNRHGHDIAHLLDYVEPRWKKDYPTGLSWRLLDTPTAGQDDLQQAPMLWISGKSDFDLGPDAGRRLRHYIDNGGFVFAEACCPKSEGFDERLRQLVGEIFPEPNLKLRTMPKEHAIWTEVNSIPPELRRPLEYVEIDGNTCLLYAPPTDLADPQSAMPSLSCLWELGGQSRAGLPPAVAREVEAALNLGENVLAYSLQSSLAVTTPPMGNALVGLPNSQLQIGNREASATIANARIAFDAVLAAQRALVRGEIDSAAANCAKAKDLTGLEKWEAAMKEFDTTFVLPHPATQGIITAYRTAKKRISDAMVVLEKSYTEERDALTEARETSDARAIEDERCRFFMR